MENGFEKKKKKKKREIMKLSLFEVGPKLLSAQEKEYVDPVAVEWMVWGAAPGTTLQPPSSMGLCEEAIIHPTSSEPFRLQSRSMSRGTPKLRSQTKGTLKQHWALEKF